MKGTDYMPLHEISPQQLYSDPFSMLSKDWMLITAGNNDEVNTMTASWGGFGILWNKPVAYIFIRPERYTRQFLDMNQTFSLTFYTEEYRKTLSYFGSISGKEEPKIRNANFNTAFIHDTPYFEEAHTILICRKLYCQNLTSSSFIDKEICIKNYPSEDYHLMYIAEITNIYENQR